VYECIWNLYVEKDAQDIPLLYFEKERLDSLLKLGFGIACNLDITLPDIICERQRRGD
jgi:hypothetical protein